MKNMHFVNKAIALIGSRHRLEIMCALVEKPMSFNELKRSTQSMTSTTLSRTLKSLATEGLVRRIVLNTQPLSVRYEATAAGKGVSSIMRAMGDWAKGFK